MKIFIFLMAFFLFVLGAKSNTFFMHSEQITLECGDVNKLSKIDDNIVDVEYSESGRKKIHTLTKNNVGKKWGLIVGDEVIFMGINITIPLLTEPVRENYSQGITFHSKNGNIDKFIDTFKGCKGVVIKNSQ